ncbi:MAG: NADH:ubiquinone reductase (Na(+)-transporting) subunit F [Kiritimatiellia bacterium]
MPDLVVNSTAPLPVAVGATILEACAAHGILLPSACGGRGFCGRCAVEVASGDLTPPTPTEENKILAEDRAKGLRLACQARIRGDVALRVDPEILAVRRHTGTLVGKTLVTPDVAHLRIAVDAHPPFAFRAGQYVQFEAALAPAPAKPVLRAYSMATAPSDPLHVEFMVRHVPNGVCSTWIHQQLQPGQPVAFRGPFGNFHLSGTDAPMVGIAGSSGMAPLRSIFHDMREKGIRRSAKFFFGARTRQDLFLLDEWAEFEKKTPGFEFIPVLSHEPEHSPWTGERGMVTDAVARRLPDLAGQEAYLCGSPGMIDAAMAVLAARGMPADHVFYDKFSV